MEENLISKKELLELTGISYGQLYRWKRKQLIPEDWFIKKSSFTGQETFFPKDKILKRVDKIMNMKEGLSLDDIADKVSAGIADLSLSAKDLAEKNVVSACTLSYFTALRGSTEIFTFETVLFMYIIDRKFLSGELSMEEGSLVLETLENNYREFSDKECELIFIRKQGISSCLLVQLPNRVAFERNTKVIFRVNIQNYIEELK